VTSSDNQALWKDAAYWYARMLEPESEQEVAAFEVWLGQDPEHARAYSEMGAISGAAAAVRHDPVRQSPAWQQHGWRPVLVAAAGVAFLLTCVVAWQGFSSPAFATISNPGGAVRGVRLRDGTLVWLDAGAEVGARSDGAHRTIVVRKGRVRIGPAANGPPLEITAGRLTIDPATAKVDVTVEGAVVTMSSLNGTIGVKSGSGQPSSLSAGEGLVFDGAGVRAAPVDLTWPVARLRFADTPLRQIVVIANRQPGPDIVFAEDSIGSLTVTGVLDLRDPRRLARKLAAAYDLRLRDEGSRVVLSR
jgi:transmembrane sensor